MKRLALIITVALTILLADPAHALKRNQLVDDPKSPHVLLIGDSISVGYTSEVRKVIAGKWWQLSKNSRCSTIPSSIFPATMADRRPGASPTTAPCAMAKLLDQLLKDAALFPKCTLLGEQKTKSED